MNRQDATIGRYVYLTLEGLEYRVYYEEAGSGPVLLCQHTAGSDGRQWRHLLEDPDVTSKFRVIAYDLPQHGKSLPALNDRWWEKRQMLTTELFVGFVQAFMDALDLRDVTYMGCSMGGHLAGDLALRCPERFRAVIGIEAGLATIGTEESVVHMDHPRVPNSFKAEVMYSLTAPQSPEWARREATWGYLNSAPSTHRGDLNYYLFDHDLTDTAADIDTNEVAVFLLSGEYDWSVTPEDTRRLADEVAGSRLIEMKGVGHFPMIENYPVFKHYIAPVLDELALNAAIRSN